MRFRYALGFAAVLASGACKLNLGPPQEPLTGEGLVFRLSTLNDNALPTTLDVGPPAVTIRSAALTLSTDSTWLFSYVRNTKGFGGSQTSTESLRGSYRRTSAVLALFQADTANAVFTGTFDAATVILFDETTVRRDKFMFAR
jgi:hypothetical protein